MSSVNWKDSKTVSELAAHKSCSCHSMVQYIFGVHVPLIAHLGAAASSSAIHCKCQCVRLILAWQGQYSAEAFWSCLRATTVHAGSIVVVVS